MRAYLGLGSNIGDRAARLKEALERLAPLGVTPLAVSRVYETEPQGLRAQEWFLNCAAEVDTARTPRQLLAAIAAVESDMGRQRVVRWGPRVIDVDILACGGVQIRTPDLEVPHPRLGERAFALIPLAEVAPKLDVPGIGPVAAGARRLRGRRGQTVRLWGSLPDLPAPPRRTRRGGSRDLLLERLRAARQPVSGATLAAELGITRSAVWKHVSRLRVSGYRIVGSPGVGYRLLRPADALSSADLVSDRRALIGRVLHVLGSVDSTNRLAREMGLEGSPAGTVVCAERQTAGRGRGDRRFLSPPGGVYLSVILRPAVPPAVAGRLTLLAAVAVAEAVEGLGGLRPEIKWPNDILLGGGKVCGILLEMVAREDRVDFVVLGVGCNVRGAPAGVGATSLEDHGVSARRAEVAGAVLDRLDAVYAEFEGGRWADILDRWRRRSRTLGRPVEVACADGRMVSGVARDVTPDGALLVEVEGGRVQTVYAGDVRHLEPPRDARGAGT